MKLLHDNSYFDYTEMINLAVQFLEGDEGRGRDARVQHHIRDDIRYVVVDEYQDVNPLQERLVKGLVQFGANLCVVGDDDQTIYQWRGSEVSNIVTFARPVRRRPAGHARRQLPIEPRASSRWAARSPSGSPPASGCRRRWSRRVTRSASAATYSPWSFAIPMPRQRGSVTASSTARARLPTRPTSEPRGLSWSDCAVLFRSVAKDSGPARRRVAAARHPVRRQGTQPALRQPGDPGRCRHLPLRGLRRSTAEPAGALR